MDSKDYEYVTTIFGLMVGVNKVGGGTLGASYSDEDWEVTVMNGDEYVYDNSVMHVGTSCDHWRAASLAAEFASGVLEESEG